ncbi:MAG: FtsX-like permease family protein [Chitinivibrionales bacterium]|nr:FtsX-like permease family protein [Chitinivibrionales bacterium]
MKPIVVKNQVRLGPVRCFRHSIGGMYFRLRRSAISILILALAVAFLSYILNYGLISRDTDYYAYSKLKDSRMLSEWISRLSSPDSDEEILSHVVAQNADRMAEYKTWGMFSSDEMALFKKQAGTIHRFVEYFNSIPRTARAILIADQSPHNLGEKLKNPDDLETFLGKVSEMKLKPPLKSRENLVHCITEIYPSFYSFTRRIRKGQSQKIAALKQHFNGRRLHDIFITADSSLVGLLRSQGYRIDNAKFEILKEQAFDNIQLQRLGVIIDRKDVKPVVARKMGIERQKVNVQTFMHWLGEGNHAAWMQDFLSEEMTGFSLSRRRLEELSGTYRRNESLQAALGKTLPVKRSGLFSFHNETLWLIVVSFLVCIVGITNTMLMSVTERFKEIATMKCLGAMDDFVMLQFVFEALFQGIVGSFIGVLIGLALAVMRSIIEYGGLIFEAFPVGDVFYSDLLSFLAGIIIASIAATWPSVVASRLAPMEAMRVE